MINLFHIIMLNMTAPLKQVFTLIMRLQTEQQK